MTTTAHRKIDPAKVDRARAAAGMRLWQLTRAAGLSQGRFGSIMAERGDPATPAELERLARALNVAVEDITSERASATSTGADDRRTTQ